MPNDRARPDFALRTFPAFSLCATIGYFMFMGFGMSPFVYYPEAGEIHRAVRTGLGPPMFWYGWMVYAAGTGIVGGLLAWLMPTRLSLALAARLSWLLWTVPIFVMLVILFLLRHYFR